jgi:hypothetical protein
MVPSYCFSLSPFLFSFSASLPLFPSFFPFFCFFFPASSSRRPFPSSLSSSCSSSFFLFLSRFPSSSSLLLLLRITCQLDLSHFCDIQPSHKQDELSAGSVLVWECSCVGGAWATRRGRTHQISCLVPLLFSAVARPAARARTQTRQQGSPWHYTPRSPCVCLDR